MNHPFEPQLLAEHFSARLALGRRTVLALAAVAALLVAMAVIFPAHFFPVVTMVIIAVSLLDHRPESSDVQGNRFPGDGVGE